jgi:SAM-dependent methyltransferase
MTHENSLSRFNQLIADALAQDFTGWDFSYLRGRMTGGDPSWNYGAIVREHLPGVRALLDYDTGGGEFLSALSPRPPLMVATEGYPPNVPVAGRRLLPLGIHLVNAVDASHLPFSSGAFDLVINRHGDYHADEIYRLLRPGGRVITQQVGGEDEIPLNRALEDEVSYLYQDFGLDEMKQEFESVGFEILDLREELPETQFKDIGAVVFYLKVISWQVPDFTVEKYEQRLLAIHQTIEERGAFRSHSHRLLLQATKPR